MEKIKVRLLRDIPGQGRMGSTIQVNKDTAHTLFNCGIASIEEPEKFNRKEINKEKKRREEELKKEQNKKEEVKDTPVKTPELPEVVLPQENRTLVSDFIFTLSELLQHKDLFYRVADSSIIEIVNDTMQIVIATRMVSLIENVCTPGIEKWVDKKGGGGYWEFHKKTASEQVCKVLLVAPQFYNQLKRIEKILTVSIPVLREGKLIFPNKGYNEELKLYLKEDAPELTKPNMDVKEAKQILDELFKEFCFKDGSEEDKTKSLFGLLTPYLRGLYDTWNTRTPVFVYFANRERAGKDYLAAIRILVFEGNATEEPPISTGQKDGGSNDELRKKFLSGMMAGKQFMHFSNNKGHINNSVFEQFITAKVYEDRILGKNEIAAFENNLELSLSANTGTTMTADLGHRSIMVNLFLGMEDVNKRKFAKPNLHTDIVENRGLILSALYSLVRNWYDRGMPEGSELFTSFPQWAKVGGGILEAAGYVNPLKKSEVEEIGMDDETADMKSLFEYMHESHGDETLTKKAIRSILIEDNDFGSSIFGWLNLEERGGQTKFGLLIDKYSGREFDKVVMKRDETVKRKSRQTVKFTSIETSKEVKEEVVV